MSDKTIAQKLMLKGGHSALIVNAPKGYLQSIGALPDGVKILSPPAGR